MSVRPVAYACPIVFVAQMDVLVDEVVRLVSDPQSGLVRALQAAESGWAGAQQPQAVHPAGSPAVSNLPFQYGSHCSSCKVTATCLAHAGGALQLSGCSPAVVRALQKHLPCRQSLIPIESLADAPDAQLVLAADDVGGNAAQMRRWKQRAAVRRPGQGRATGGANEIGASSNAAGAATAVQPDAHIVRMLDAVRPSSLPIWSSDLIQVFTFVTWDAAARRIVAMAAKVVCGKKEEEVLRLVDSAWQQVAASQSFDSSSKGQRGIDDSMEAGVLSSFCRDMDTAVDSVAGGNVEKVPVHLYFVSRTHGNKLRDRLEALGLRNQHAALMQLLCATASIPGEQPMVSYLEEEATTQFAVQWHGCDLYTLTQVPWGAGRPGGTPPVAESLAEAFRFNCCDTLSRRQQGGPRVQVRIRSTSAAVPPGYFWAYWQAKEDSGCSGGGERDRMKALVESCATPQDRPSRSFAQRYGAGGQTGLLTTMLHTQANAMRWLEAAMRVGGHQRGWGRLQCSSAHIHCMPQLMNQVAIFAPCLAAQAGKLRLLSHIVILSLIDSFSSPSSQGAMAHGKQDLIKNVVSLRNLFTSPDPLRFGTAGPDAPQPGRHDLVSASFDAIWLNTGGSCMMWQLELSCDKTPLQRLTDGKCAVLVGLKMEEKISPASLKTAAEEKEKKFELMGYVYGGAHGGDVLAALAASGLKEGE